MAEEGSNQKGYIYESNAYNALKKYKISAGSGPARAASDRPDLQIKNRTKTAGCELKLAPTAAGSLVMKYMKGKWSFGETDGDDEKELLKFVGTQYKILNTMNSKSSKWGKNVPNLQNDPSNPKIKMVKGKRFSDYPVDRKRAFYESDIKRYGGQNEVKVIVPAKFICDYYISKKCSYLNIGTHGFYTLNNRDDLGLNAYLRKMRETVIPNFAESVVAEIRVRCQLKSASKADYQFVMTLQFKSAKASPYNIAPTISKDNAGINTRVLGGKDNLPLLEAFG